MDHTYTCEKCEVWKPGQVTFNYRDAVKHALEYHQDKVLKYLYYLLNVDRDINNTLRFLDATLYDHNKCK